MASDWSSLPFKDAKTIMGTAIDETCNWDSEIMQVETDLVKHFMQ